MRKDIIWLIRGSQRKKLFVSLPVTPFLSNKLRKEINEKIGTSLSLREMSRHLRDLEKINLVRCLNNKDPYNRIYELTLNGKRAKKELLELGL